MQIEGFEEIKDIYKITVQPGQSSDVIKRFEKSSLIIIAISGFGTVHRADRELGHILSYRSSPRLDFRHGDEFVIDVSDEAKEPLTVILMQVVMTKYIEEQEEAVNG